MAWPPSSTFTGSGRPLPFSRPYTVDLNVGSHRFFWNSLAAFAVPAWSLPAIATMYRPPCSSKATMKGASYRAASSPAVKSSSSLPTYTLLTIWSYRTRIPSSTSSSTELDVLEPRSTRLPPGTVPVCSTTAIPSSAPSTSALVLSLLPAPEPYTTVPPPPVHFPSLQPS